MSSANEAAPREPRPEPPAAAFELLGLLRSAWRSLALFVLFGSALALGWGVSRGSRFQARATILIERESAGGLLGDLAALASLTSAPAAASELVVLESRALAEETLREGRSAEGGWDPLNERAVGLATVVDDVALAPLQLLRRTLFDPPAPEEPLVLPPRELHARVLSATPDAPRRLRLTFLGSDRLRVEEERLLCRLGLVSSQPETLIFEPRRTLAYRGLAFELDPQGDFATATFTLEHRPLHEALEWLQERLRVREVALGSGMIEIAVVDSDPRRAARTANALGRNYLTALAERGRRRASRTVDYVSGLLEQAGREFDQAQHDIQTLQEAHPELLAPEGSANTLIEQISTLEVERVQTELARRTLEEIVTALAGGDPRALARLDNTVNVGVLVDPLTSGFLQELARLEAQHDALGADLLPDHPLVRSNREAAAALISRTRLQLEERVQGLLARETALDATGQALRERMREMPSGVRDLAEAHVRIQIHRELVPYLVKSLQGAEISRTGAETLAEFIDHAAPPSEPNAPDALRLLALGALLGLSVGAGATLLRAPRQARVRRADDLARALQSDLGLELARRAPRGALALRDQPAGAAAEALRSLRSSLRMSQTGAPPRTLGVTTVAEDELGSYLAAELALGFAREGRRTLLLEADLRRPSQARRLRVDDPGPGLAAALDRDGPDWRALVRPTGTEGLTLLPAGTSTVAPGDLLTRSTLNELIAAAAMEHDVVVVDLPESERAPEVLALAARFERLAIVHQAGALPRWRLARAGAALATVGARTTAILVLR